MLRQASIRDMASFTHWMVMVYFCAAKHVRTRTHRGYGSTGMVHTARTHLIPQAVRKRCEIRD